MGGCPRKLNINGETVTLDPDGPLAEAAWAKQRPCGLSVQNSCPHASACLTCPMFVTTPQFLATLSGSHQPLQEPHNAGTDGSEAVIRADNSTHLITAAQRPHELTRAKVIRALRELDQLGSPVDFEAIARQAEGRPLMAVHQSDIKDQIQQLWALGRRMRTTPTPSRQRCTESSLRQRLDAANNRIRELAEETSDCAAD